MSCWALLCNTSGSSLPKVVWTFGRVFLSRLPVLSCCQASNYNARSMIHNKSLLFLAYISLKIRPLRGIWLVVKCIVMSKITPPHHRIQMLHALGLKNVSNHIHPAGLESLNSQQEWFKSALKRLSRGSTSPKEVLRRMSRSATVGVALLHWSQKRLHWRRGGWNSAVWATQNVSGRNHSKSRVGYRLPFDLQPMHRARILTGLGERVLKNGCHLFWCSHCHLCW
jgi:hypothetical protein